MISEEQEEDWEEDDDYLSLDSQAEDEEDDLLIEAYAAQLKTRKFGRKGKGTGKGKSRGFAGKGSTADRNRSDEPPPGFTKEDWMRRSPCPGCGSRFHRDCTQPRTGKGKGSRKGKGKSKGSHMVLNALAVSPNPSCEHDSFVGW